MSDTVIKVENLSKKYILSHQSQEKYTALRDVMANGARNLGKKFLSPFTPSTSLRAGLHPSQSSDSPFTASEDFYALRDVSFEIKQGDRVGIIGRNGAGKSTLLKILSRITEPTSGKIEISGRVASLLEVGTGFHPELTGRENIFLNGAILGMGKAEIKRKFDEIVAFSEVERFLDTPVKRYSSGMYVRLAFAVAAHLEPEILIVDEVLAVGDAQFQKKCLGKMEEVGKEGRTVIFVSHNMGAINALCTKGIFLNAGHMELSGNISEVVDRYLDIGKASDCEIEWNDPANAPGDEIVKLKAVRIVCEGEVTGNVAIDKDVFIEIEFWNLREDAEISSSIHLLHNSGVTVLATGNGRSSTIEYDGWYGKPHPIGLYKTVCKIPANFLNEGIYHVNVFVILDVNNIRIGINEIVSFEVHDTGEMRGEFTGHWIGVIRPKMAWSTSLSGNINA